MLADDVLRRIDDLQLTYIDALDSKDMAGWLHTFQENAAEYYVIPREHVEDNLPLSLLHDDCRARLLDRVNFIDTVWAGLNDPEILKACIAGCESLERTGDDAFQALVAVRVGPVSAKFKGNLKLLDVKPPTSYTIQFDGQGGVAGFGKGSADVTLAAEGSGTKLSSLARAQVGGKMAQVGSRLIDAAAAKIAEDFFTAFEAALLSLTDEGRERAGEVSS